MRKALVALGIVALVSAGVFYAVTRLPQQQPEPLAVDTGIAPQAAPPIVPTPIRGAAPAAESAGAGIQASAFAPDSQSWAVCSTGCGRERWLVKTFDDPARDQVDLTHIIDASVTQLALFNTAATTLVGRSRRAPIETTVYRVEAILVGVLAEKDHDYHLILADPRDLQTTLIAEIPDPNCEAACASGFASRYARARQLVDQHFSSRQVAVRVTGVGFIDFNHGQAGAAPNQVELHPVLDIEFP